MTDIFQKNLLTGSVNGLPIAINAITAGSANTIHTSSSTNIDELWCMAFNYSNIDQTLYILIGGTSASQIFSQVIPAGRGLVPILSGIVTTGSVVIKAYSSLTGSISVVGFANVIVTV